MSKVPVQVQMNRHSLEGNIPLPGSKSESNRALILQALSGMRIGVKNVSEAEDTRTMLGLLAKVAQLKQGEKELTLDVGPAGTVMRFLTAFLSIQEGKSFLLTGSERMLERPIKVLADALNEMGADIEYLNKTGFPPLRIKGKNLNAKKISIPGHISSQFISALLMIAPVLAEGLLLEIEGELTSRPYVEMTLDMMKLFGIRSVQSEHSITIVPQAYQGGEISIEPDWSGSSYWFSVAALSEKADLFLEGLHEGSMQGDSAILEIMKSFGVEGSFEKGGLRIRKTISKTDHGILNFKECPDLAQTVIACAAGLGQKASFTGLETLKIKETDRIAAMQTELAKLGMSLIEDGLVYHLDITHRKIPEEVHFSTYHDHRMAMALAPLALVIPRVIFDDRDVVAKSYPSFWDHLSLTGFQIQDHGR